MNALRALALLTGLLTLGCGILPTGPGEPSFTPPPDFTPPPTVGVGRPSGPPVTLFETMSGDPVRIEIPRLAIDLPMAEHDGTGAIPEGTAWRLRSSATPGRGSNAVIFSHARPGSFSRLWDARPGDEIAVSFNDGTRARYSVVEVKPLVLATDLRPLLPTEDERLTLQTSTGPEPHLPKFIVIARRVA